MIHKVDNGFVISSRHVWMPGTYESERAARFAFKFSDAVLSQLQREAGVGVITFEALKEARKRMTGRFTLEPRP